MADDPTKASDNQLTEEQQKLRDDAQATFRRVQFALQMKHPDQALRMLTPLLDRLQKSAQEEPDCLPDRLDFTDPAQAYLYLNAHPDVDPNAVKPTVAPYTDAYGIHSALLYALGRYEDAAAAIDNALRSTRWSATSRPRGRSSLLQPTSHGTTRSAQTCW